MSVADILALIEQGVDIFARAKTALADTKETLATDDYDALKAKLDQVDQQRQEVGAELDRLTRPAA